MKLTVNRIMYGLAALCFLLALLGVGLGALDLVTLGLLFIALGLLL
ncbi:MAG: hypothetical protein WD602_03220 [Actinomycetota bacterium]